MEIKFSKGFKKSFDQCFSSKPWYAIPRWFRNAKWGMVKAWQRIFRGYDETWWWNLHYKITETVLANLRILRKSHHGYPGSLTDKEWEDILDTMIEGFEAARRIEDTFIPDKKDQKIFEEGMALFVKYYFNLWD